MAETRRSRADIKLDEKCCADCIIYRVCITLISLPHKKQTQQCPRMHFVVTHHKNKYFGRQSLLYQTIRLEHKVKLVLQWDLFIPLTSFH